jgi:hypothetical protein
MKLTICSRRFFGTGCGRAGVMVPGAYHSRRFFPAAFPDWLNCIVSWPDLFMKLYCEVPPFLRLCGMAALARRR